MLQITIPASELWDESKQEFVYAKAQTLQLEHSLVSLRKWESKWGKPFLSKDKKTDAEILDYIQCMTLTQHIQPEVYLRLTEENIRAIDNYINAPMTATTFSNDKNTKRSREIITAEIIYYWMFSLQIPLECQKWHLNQLLTLIRVFNVKNAPPKKRSQRDTWRQYEALNAARKRQLNSKG